MCWCHGGQSCKQHVSNTSLPGSHTSLQCYGDASCCKNSIGNCKVWWGIWYSICYVDTLCSHIFLSCQTYQWEGRCSSFLLTQKRCWSHQLMLLLCTEMILRKKCVFLHILTVEKQPDCTAGKTFLPVTDEVKKSCDRNTDFKWLARNICRLWRREESK